jgi:hypothetical protein
MLLSLNIRRQVLCGNEGPYFYIEFMHGHGQLSDNTYEAINSECKMQELVKDVPKSKVVFE